MANNIAEAQAALAAISAEERVLDERETASARAWAENPGDPLPARLGDQRRLLAQRRELLVADLASAQVQAAAVERHMRDLNTQIGSIGAAIYRVKLRGVLAELPDIEREIIEARDRHVKAMTRLRGISAALGEEIVALRGRGELVLAADVQGAQSKIEGMKSPEPNPITWAAITAESARVRQAFR